MTPRRRSPALLESTATLMLKMFARLIVGDRLVNGMSMVWAPLTVIVRVAEPAWAVLSTSVIVIGHGTEDASAYRTDTRMPVVAAKLSPRPLPPASYSSSIRPSASTVDAYSNSPLLGNTPAVTESAIVAIIVAETVNFRTPPTTPASPESVTVVVPTVVRTMPGGFRVVTALVKSSTTVAASCRAPRSTNSGTARVDHRPRMRQLSARRPRLLTARSDSNRSGVPSN